jgi:ABC-type transporter Mla maintaining outer membrane lipid asymmetry ATPase subunit MlaF
MTTSSHVFIEFDNVRKAFGERVVLDGVTLSIRAGETVALLGPSGGGKSTLLRTVNSLCDFDSGAIRVGSHQLCHSGGSSGNGSHTEAVRQIRRLACVDTRTSGPC